MAQTLLEKIGKSELFHKTISFGEYDLDITIKSDGEIDLHQVTEIKDSVIRNTVSLPIELFEKLIGYGPQVIEEAKRISGKTG